VSRKLAGVFGNKTSQRYNPAYDGLTADEGARWSGEVRIMRRDPKNDPLRRRADLRIAVCTMGDLFYQGVPEASIRQVFGMMNQVPRHTFMVLTKRPARMAELAPSLVWTPNIWAGTTVESASYVGRIDELRLVPAARRFICLQPLLGAMPALNLEGISWVLVGGESGAGGRPTELEWVRGVRDQCLAHGVPFWFEQIRGDNDRMQKQPLLDGRTWQDMPPLREAEQAA
jgi:protein gp37